MPTLLTKRLPSGPAAPSLARAALRDLPSVHLHLPTLELLVTELVTNSVQHASLASSEQIELIVIDSGGCLRVEVRDPGRGYTEARAAWSHTRNGSSSRLPKQNSYGLFIVKAQADRAGIIWDNGTVAWFELDAR